MGTVDELRALLPWWVGWLGVAVTALVAPLWTAGVMLLLQRIALRHLQQDRPEHWVDKARLAYPARAISLQATIMLAVSGAMLGRSLHGPLSALPAWALSTLGGIAAGAAAAWLHVKLERRLLQRSLSLAHWLCGVIALLLLFASRLLTTVVLVSLAPQTLGQNLWWLALAVVALPLGGAVWWWVARALRLVRRAPEPLRAAVTAVAATAGVELGGVWLVVSPSINAFAMWTLAKPFIGFTDAAARGLSVDQLEAVAAHEVGHLLEPRNTRVLRILSAWLWLPIAAAVPIAGSVGGPAGLIAALAGVGALIAARGWWQRREQQADRHAHDHLAYAAALERLGELNLLPAVTHYATTHPHLYDRLVAAGYAPGYARPKPPPRSWLFIPLVAAMLAPVLLADRGLHSLALRALRDPAMAPLALSVGQARVVLAAVGREHWLRGDTALSIAYLRAAAVNGLSRSDAALLAGLLADAGRCDDAAAAAADLDARCGDDEDSQRIVAEVESAVAECLPRGLDSP